MLKILLCNIRLSINCFTCMQPSTVGSFGPPSTSVAASFVDRAVPMTSMVGDTILIK